MPLRPLPNLRQVRSECSRRHIARPADENGAITQPRVALDVLDHFRVVVGRQLDVVLAQSRHRQPADEVGQPDVSRLLQLRVLVQVVVHLPCFVADPEVVITLPHSVEKDHEVGKKDFVHSTPRLEDVETMRTRLELDVPRLACQVAAGRVNRLAMRLEHSRDRILCEPLDLKVRNAMTKLAGNGHVSTGVAKADRRGHEERPPRPARAPPALGSGPGGQRKVAKSQVDRYGITKVGNVARPLHRQQPAVSQFRQSCAVGVHDDLVLVPVDHKHRAYHTPGELRGPDLVHAEASVGGEEYLRRRLQTPCHRVFEGFGRVGLGKSAPEEELEKSAMGLKPVVRVEFHPVDVLLELLVEDG